MANIETSIFHSYFAYSLYKNGYRGSKIKNPEKVGTQEVIFDDSECDLFMSTYDQENCVNVPILIGFIKRTQNDKYQELYESCGADTDNVIGNSLVEEIKTNGMLGVLKNGFKIRGMSFDMYYEVFAKKPSDFAIGQKEKEDYAENEFWCLHEFKYCQKMDERIDFSVFINGLPIFDFELKTKLSGAKYTYSDAIKQYESRVKSSKTGGVVHKYWNNQTGPLAHFAVDDNTVFMCTDVKEEKSRFVPFNIGQGIGKSKKSGNPVAASGFSCEYLYKEFVPASNLEDGMDFIDNILSKDMVADIVNGFAYYENGKLIFPRYHQLNAVVRLENDIKNNIRDGGMPGKNYLIQHSAGSGKTKSITWLAYKAQTLRTKDSNYLFGSVIVLTDRKVVIGQLGDSIWANDKREDDMIARIDLQSNKSTALKTALENNKRIILCTIQSFLDLEAKIDFSIDKKYLIIVDESHASTDGKDIEAVKSSLATEKEEKNITFIGFTATPKKATLRTFGSHSVTYVDKNGNEKQEFLPFDVYSMRQAIEEKYILDVFEAYKTLEAHCELVLIAADKEVQRNYAEGILAGMKDDKGLTISNKVDFIIRDFFENVYGTLNGEEKAMILANSKEEATEYYKCFKEKLSDSVYKEMQSVNVLIAYSGKNSDDKEENDYNGLNPSTEFDVLQKAFDINQSNKMLLVVDKYQTGYDQPKLCVMYIDKDLQSEVQIVQTLSRLNRPYYTAAGKLKSISVIDFRNNFDRIKSAFETYYETTYLLRTHMTVSKLDEFMQRLLDNKILNNKMLADIRKGLYSEISIVGQSLEEEKKSGDPFLVAQADNNISDIYNYTRLYGMLLEDDDERTKIINNQYSDAYKCLERMKNFISSLLKPKGRKKEEITSDVGQFITGQKIDAHAENKTLTSHGEISQGFVKRKLRQNDDKEKLSVLIMEFNGTDRDSISKFVDKLSHKPSLRSIANNSTNTKADFVQEFKKFFMKGLEDLLDSGDIDMDKYSQIYGECDQIAGLVYDKIKNTKL